MALNGLFCADVSLRSYSLTQFNASNTNADFSFETKSTLINIGELKLCTHRKHLKEMK